MTLVARAVFVMLVGATFAAFFVAQRLKSAPPAIGLERVTRDFSPNGDGRRDLTRIRMRVQDADDVTVAIVDAQGDVVRRVASARPMVPDRRYRLTWDGRTDAGARAPEGVYRIRIGLRRQGRALTFPRDIRLDVTPPEPVVSRLDADLETPGDQWILGPRPAPVRVTIGAPSLGGPTIVRVLNTDADPPVEVARFESSGPGVETATWDGRLADGTGAPPGTYLLALTARDVAGNRGTTPRLPPVRGSVPGVPGVSVRRILARPPADPVGAGTTATFAVDSRGRPFEWSIRRLGNRTILRKGRRETGGELRVRVPRVPSGVHLFEARTGRGLAEEIAVPFVVQAGARGRVLVVLPAVTWYGASELDDGRDGLPDTLAAGAPANWPRLLARMPGSLPDELAPLLGFLDRQGLRYDVTTDLALAASRSALSPARRGVLLPIPLRWVSRPLARRLRTYVAQGGSLATFGADTLRRGVTIGQTQLLRPLPPSPDDPFGARLRPVRLLEPGAPPLLPVADEGDTGLLTGIDELVGFRVLEESEPSEQVEVALAAVDEQAIAEAEAAGELIPESRPALTLSRLGDGRVIRVGLPEWGRRLHDDPQVRQLTRNIIDLLRDIEPRIRF